MTARPRRRDGGFTAIEMLVAAMIGSVVLAGVATVMVSTASTARQTAVHTGNSRSVRGAAEVVTTALRVGIRPNGEPSAVVVAKPDEITFYTLINRTGAAATASLPPTLTRYWWDSATSCLNQSRVAGVDVVNPGPTGPFYTWTAAPEVRCVMKTTAKPDFRYFTTAAISVGASVIPDMGAPASGLSAAQLPQVRSVQVQLTARDPADPGVAPSVVLDRVTLSNS